MEPFDLCIPLEPRELLAHVLPCVRLDLSHGLLFGDLSVEMCEEFFIAHCVERVHPALRIHTPSLGLKSSLHHLKHSRVDAGIEFFTRAVESDFQDSEWTHVWDSAGRRCGNVQGQAV